MELGMLGLALPSGCVGCTGCAGCAGYAGALAAGSRMPFLTMKSVKVVLGDIIGLNGPLPSGSENCQMSLANAYVLTAVSQLSH